MINYCKERDWRECDRCNYYKVELNKEAILGDYIDKKKATELKPDELKEKLTDEKLATVGLRVDQEETFSYVIKWDELISTNEC